MKQSPIFRDWLREAVEKSGLPKREIARRMAVKHPRGVNTDTIETARRTLNKVLAGDLTPTQPTREWIADALERDDAPSVADEDDEDSDVSSLLLSIAAEQAVLNRRLNRALRAVKA